MMFDNHKLGAYILYLRKKNGMTQSRLAELLGVSPQAVSNWERGESMPDIALLGSVARALGTTADKILAAAENYEAGGEQPESPDEELDRLKAELDETKRKVREAEERAKSGESQKSRVYVHIPSWQEVSDKLPDLQDVAENAKVFGKDVTDKAKEVFDAASDFTRKHLQHLEREVERRRRERAEQRERAADTDDDEEEMDLSLIVTLAPFASQEGVDAMLDNLPAENVKSLHQLNGISPFAGEEALGRLTRRVLEAHPNADHVPGLIALASYLSEADLRDIVMEERCKISVSQIAAFAPYMNEKDIDALILRAARKKKSAEPKPPETPEDSESV